MNQKSKYSSFEDIDKDLKRLYLQSEIAKEELKLSVRQTKNELSPGKVVTSVVGGVATTALLFKLLTPFITFGIGKFLNKYK